MNKNLKKVDLIKDVCSIDPIRIQIGKTKVIGYLVECRTEIALKIKDELHGNVKCYAFGVRHSEVDWAEPITISPNYVVCNSFGVMIAQIGLKNNIQTETPCVYDEDFLCVNNEVLYWQINCDYDDTTLSSIVSLDDLVKNL